MMNGGSASIATVSVSSSEMPDTTSWSLPEITSVGAGAGAASPPDVPVEAGCVAAGWLPPHAARASTITRHNSMLSALFIWFLLV
ncbi:MAG: hypothetical protein J6P48_01935 [Oscillospiraceae bacterium]|nr:hypothetical protein [Oscillospiraceae bacterium]